MVIEPVAIPHIMSSTGWWIADFRHMSKKQLEGIQARRSQGVVLEAMVIAWNATLITHPRLSRILIIIITIVILLLLLLLFHDYFMTITITNNIHHN